MKPQAFDRSEHVYRNDAFAELVKDAVRFFNGTPVHTLPPPESFLGTGVSRSTTRAVILCTSDTPI